MQDDLSSFIHNWESVVAGMSHVPDERTLRDILLRQIRRSARMKWDLDLCDRAKEGTPTHSYNFLIQSIRDLLTRDRVRRNRDRIAKSHGDKFRAPVLRKEGTRPQSGGRGRPPSRDSNASFRSRSSSRASQGRSSSPKAVCYEALKGKCTRGANCKFLHKKRSPSPKPPDKQKRSTKFACTGRKGNVLEVTNAGSCTSPTGTERHHHLGRQEQRTLPPQRRLLATPDMFHKGRVRRPRQSRRF